mgnify:CR=1 FL=1
MAIENPALISHQRYIVLIFKIYSQIARLQMKTILFSALRMCLGLWMLENAALLNVVYPAEETSSIPQALTDSASSQINCPTDLSHLQAKMKEVLQFVKPALIRDTLLASLHASIPGAIVQMDGLAGQITFLKQEIVRQEQERVRAEEIAKGSLDDPSKPLVPCRSGMEGSYCHAMDQYYVSIAANLANRAFLNALECYQRHGVR